MNRGGVTLELLGPRIISLPRTRPSGGFLAENTTFGGVLRADFGRISGGFLLQADFSSRADFSRRADFSQAGFLLRADLLLRADFSWLQDFEWA
jgi:hypothetical protein